MSARKLRPRRTESLGIVPLIVSDLTSHAAFGTESRTFKDIIVAKKIPHERFGHRWLVRAQDFVNAIGADAASLQATPHEGDEPGVDDLLARIGRRRA